ncbi:MAG TPA: VOC family protein [Chitinophagaceae bacterium]|jgi:hypothetical protein
MDATTNSLDWFEIPVIDMPRAKHFYQVLFSIHMDEFAMGDMQMSFFPSDPQSGKLSGGLAKSPYHTPSMEGVIVYINGNPDLSSALDKVVDAGGEVLMPKTAIGSGHGFMAFFKDTEGNRVGIHSNA